VRRGTAGVLLLLAVLLLAGGCGNDAAKKRDAAAAARARAQARLHARRVDAGRALFAGSCAGCHKMEGRVGHPKFVESPIPDLDQVKPQLAYAHERIRHGGFDMPTFEGELTDAQMLAIATYVTEIGGSRVIDTSRQDPDAPALGEQVFRENCERCHAIAGRRASNRPLPAYPGTDFNLVKPSQQMVMERALKGIREQMPSFRGKLTRAQLHAVAVYVTATAGE
jgi:cbb3-type cytochrome c oxidase subunit III